jgi:hypothetical protein
MIKRAHQDAAPWAAGQNLERVRERSALDRLCGPCLPHDAESAAGVAAEAHKEAHRLDVGFATRAPQTDTALGRCTLATGRRCSRIKRRIGKEAAADSTRRQAVL